MRITAVARIIDELMTVYMELIREDQIANASSIHTEINRWQQEYTSLIEKKNS